MPRLRATIFAAVALWAVGGCRHPAPLSVRIVPAHKDVLHVHVELPGPLEPLEYLGDSQRRTGTVAERMASVTAPLYEVHYSYFSGTDLLAFVTFRRAPDGTLKHEKTLVHPSRADRGDD